MARSLFAVSAGGGPRFMIVEPFFPGFAVGALRDVKFSALL
jgi:hypothetical protein